MNNKLRIFNAKWSSRSSGPSPDNNRRTEIFLAGCKKALRGDPCKGCFNSALWSECSCVAEVTPDEALRQIEKYAPNKYITFVGGEPLDQINPLAELCRILKEKGFHIIVITHYLGEHILSTAKQDKAYEKFVKNVDAIVDGEYMEEYRIWDDSRAGDGLHDVIGSGNQRIWEFHHGKEEKMFSIIASGDLESWGMDTNQKFVYNFKKAEGKHGVEINR